MAIIPYSILIIGVVAIPLSPKLTSSVLISVSNGLSLSYDKMPVQDKEIFYKIKGEATYSLAFEQVTDSKAGKLLSLLKTVLEVVANLKTDTWGFDPSTKEKIEIALKSNLTKCSYFDSTGLFSFFNYRITGVDFSTNIDGGLTSITLNFSNGANEEKAPVPFDSRGAGTVKIVPPSNFPI